LADWNDQRSPPDPEFKIKSGSKPGQKVAGLTDTCNVLRGERRRLDGAYARHRFSGTGSAQEQAILGPAAVAVLEH
jgi:hypothetical protein